MQMTTYYKYKTLIIVVLQCLGFKLVATACSYRCDSCDELQRCTSCKSGYWGLNTGCSYKCPYNCRDGKCEPETGKCAACEPGLYGYDCHQNCSLCVDDLCDLQGCTKACKNGHYEYRRNNEVLCWPCPDCMSCSSANTCTACNEGFHLYKFELNGIVYVYCIKCSSADDCLNKCLILNCNQCQVQYNSLICTECAKGHFFNGDICLTEENNCSKGCSTFCSGNGICPGSCNAGWTGKKCSELCVSQCRHCSKNNATICEECNGDFYTQSCNLNCSSSCTKVAGKHTCRLSDGHCNNRCENKFWGPFCNRSCSKSCIDDGISTVCDRHNGTCIKGCINTCETMDLTDSTDYETEKNGNDASEGNIDGNNILVYILLGTGFAVVVIAAASLLYCIRRNFVYGAHSRRFGTTEMSTYSNGATGQPLESETTENDTENYVILSNYSTVEYVYNELEEAEMEQHI